MELVSWEITPVHPIMPGEVGGAGAETLGYSTRELNFMMDTVKYVDDGFVIGTEQQRTALIGSSTQVGSIWVQKKENIAQPSAQAGTTNALGIDVTDRELSEDLQDFTARGVLIASPTIYLYSVQKGRAQVLTSVGTVTLVDFDLNDDVPIVFDMYYRFVQVPLAEYLGIIQSQQLAQRLA